MSVHSRKKKNKEINLLPKDSFSAGVGGRLLEWLLTSFRVIVIVTELIVMVAFLSRFFLDSKNADLNDEIKQKSAFISASLPFENEFKQTQRRLKIIAGFYEANVKKSVVVKEVATNTPSDISLQKILINETSVSIIGLSSNERGVQQFITNLDANTSLSDVVLQKLETDFESKNQLKFTLAMKVKTS